MRKVISKILIVVAGILLVMIILEIAIRVGGYIYLKRSKPEITGKGNANYTILCLGDSHTRGMGAPQGFDYPSQLGLLLNNKSKNKFKVINEGIVNQNTSQLLYKLPGLISTYKPDLIILLTGVDNKKWSYYGYSSKFNNVIYRIKLVKLIYLLVNNIKEKNFLSQDFNEEFIPESKDFRNVLASLNKQLKVNPGNDKFYYSLGLLYLNRNKCDDAVKYFKKAIEINKNEPKYYFAISNAYKLTGSFKESQNNLDEGLKVNNSCDFLLLAKAKIFIEEADYQNALVMVEKGITYNPLCINFYQYLNSLRNSGNNFKPDIDSFYSAHKINTSEKYYLVAENNNNEFWSYRLRSESKDDLIMKQWITRDLNNIVGIIKNSNSKLIIMNYYFDDFPNSILEETAKKYNVPFVNNHDIFLKLGKDIMKYREPSGYGFGGHPNANGYELIAHNIVEELEKINPDLFRYR